MREALRHLVEPVPQCGPEGYAARWAAQAAEALAAADALAADLASWSPWDEDGESRGYRDVIAEWKEVRDLYHQAGIYAARAAGDWRNCHGAKGVPCPGCEARDARTKKEYPDNGY